MSKRLAMLISGGGTTAREVIRATKSGRLTGIIPALVIASNPDAEGIIKARDEGISVEDILVIDPRDYDSSEEFGLALIAACRERNIDIVHQLGWMPLTPANFIAEYEGSIINQHPGPLDPGREDFGGKGMYGKRVHQARLLFVRETGHDYWTEVVAQRVATEFDKGAVLVSARVEILPDDTATTLQQRALLVEHAVQIQVLQHFADGTVQEIVRSTPLIPEHELPALVRAKRQARKDFPNG